MRQKKRSLHELPYNKIIKFRTQIYFFRIYEFPIYFFRIYEFPFTGVGEGDGPEPPGPGNGQARGQGPPDEPVSSPDSTG